MEKLANLEEGLLVEIEVLNGIGDFLRDENNRKGDLLVANLSKLILICNTSLPSQDQQYKLAGIRVLVNLSADNDYNRQHLLENEKLWLLIADHFKLESNLDVLQRLILFLNQFIYSELKNQYLQAIFDTAIFGDRILEVLIEFQPLTLFFKELIQVNLSKILQLDNREFYINLIDLCLKRLYSLCQEELDEDDEEEVENIADILFNLTMFEDLEIDLLNANYRVLSIMNVIPDITNITKVKRQLFAASGNITSMKNHHDEAKIAIDMFQNSSDPYTLSASAITLGNYVISLDKCEELLVLIEKHMGLETFIAKFLSIQINDVIQIQMFHVLTKIINQETSKYILVNNEQLVKFSKLVQDNYQYYPEVGKVYYKFVKKFIKIQFIDGHTQILGYLPIWELLTDEEIKLLLLQSYCGDYIEQRLTIDESNFINDLVASSLAIDSSITMEVILQKIKTLSILFHSLNSKKITINSINETDTFFKLLNQLLTKMSQEIIPQAQGQPQNNILINNSRFLSISIIQFVENKFPTSTNDDIISIGQTCRKLVDEGN